MVAKKKYRRGLPLKGEISDNSIHVNFVPNLDEYCPMGNMMIVQTSFLCAIYYSPQDNIIQFSGAVAWP